MYHHIYFVNTSLTNSAKNLQCFLNAHMLMGVCRFICWYHTRMWEYICLRVCDTLTTFHRNRGSLQRQHLPIGLRDVHSKHHTDTRVLPSYICLPFSKLNIWISQFKDAGTVDTERQRAETFGLGSSNIHKKYWGHKSDRRWEDQYKMPMIIKDNCKWKEQQNPCLNSILIK